MTEKMHKGQITIKDIAKELGISPSTVSKALKGHRDISTSTKQSVRELAKKWNYKPDQIALSLRSGLSKTIGVIVPEIVHYFFSTVISGIEDLAYDSGYHVMFCQSSESYAREVKAVETLLSNRVDGILVSVSKDTDNFDHFRKIQDNGIALVFFDRICDEIITDRVIVDDETGAYEAVSHLISIGCKNIIHLSGPPNLLIGKNRKDGYLRALRDHNMPLDENNIIRCDSREEATLIVPGLLNRDDNPDGFFAVNDLTAAATMKIILDMGYSIPDNIAVVGFTSGLISDITNPTLTSVKQNGYLIGKEAVRLLIDRLEKKHDFPLQTKVIKTELVIKGSTLRKQT
ncbi:MAG TPA: LacI family DNA-binding transcriptional regulator [Bacteroidales bacterium]|nr:LacI family DNA-binding transcriptional regulator [Bacteroidales bacterium]